MGTEPFFIGSVPKGVHSRLWTFLGTERIQLEPVTYRLHVEFCRSRSPFYPGRSNFFGRVNGPKVDDAAGDSGVVRPKREKHWCNKEKGDPVCIFCEGRHWGDACEGVNTIEARRQFFQKLCFNCGRAGHWGKQCRSRGCFKCKSKHHTSLCDKDKNRPPGDNGTVLTSYSPSADE